MGNILPADKDTKDIMVGVTGIFLVLKSGELQVTKIASNTQAEKTLKVGHLLPDVDGKPLEIQNSAIPSASP